MDAKSNIIFPINESQYKTIDGWHTWDTSSLFEIQ
jgi:hypothetical protein